MIKATGRFFRTGSFVVAMLFVLLFMANGAIAKTGGAAGETEAKTKAAETYGKLPLSFIQNNGQTMPLSQRLNISWWESLCA